MSTEPVKREYFSGLDLGQLQEPTALVVTERTRSAAEKEYRYAVRHIHRWHLGTGYPEIVADVKKMFAVPPLTRSMLAIDRTGVGKAVTNQFTEAGIPAQVQPYLITAGHTPATYTVPKVDLVGVLQTLLGMRRLKIADSLPLAEVLTKELELFRMKVTLDKDESFASWRERPHDDIVLSLALACWYGQKPQAWII
jgi:hypothetical protein